MQSDDLSLEIWTEMRFNFCGMLLARYVTLKIMTIVESFLAKSAPKGEFRLDIARDIGDMSSRLKVLVEIVSATCVIRAYDTLE